VVAIKLILPGVLKDDEALELFNREVRAAACLHHPNIATAYDANQVRGTQFLVMEYVEGPSLHALVKDRGPLPVDLACELMRQAATALQYAHEKGVVHRDVKPANLLVTHPPGLQGQGGGRAVPPGPAPGPVLKVVDFGLARVRSAGGRGAVDTIRAEPGAVCGTADYISPEQAHDVHGVDIRSDLYSLGCTFYYALTGQPPFPGGNAMEKLLKHLMREPEPLRARRPEVPAAVGAIVRRLTAKDPNQRFQTPAELARELGPFSGTAGRPGRIAAAEVEAPAHPPAGLPGARGAEGPPWQPADEGPTVVHRSLPPAVPAPSDDTPFREKFRRWTAVVELTLRRRGALPRIDREAFNALQQDLVRACHVQASAAEDRRRQFYQQLEELLKPWLSPEALANTDLEIHYQLVREFRQAERQLDAWIAASGPGGNQTTFGRIFTFFRKRRE
jgi:hypothetical protein